MGFEELLTALRSGDYPETIYDDLGAAYSTLADNGNAAVAEYQARVAALEAEIQSLKAHNYELMMVGGAPEPTVEESADEAEHYEGEGESFDDLFTDDKEGDE